MFQVLKNNEIINSSPVIQCILNSDNENVAKMEIKAFMDYARSNTPLFYRYQLTWGKLVTSRVL